MTTEEKYRNDSQFHMLVDYMVSIIGSHGFTPSELREAAVCASIKFELMHVREYVVLEKDINTALEHMRELRERGQSKRNRILCKEHGLPNCFECNYELEPKE